MAIFINFLELTNLKKEDRRHICKYIEAILFTSLNAIKFKVRGNYAEVFCDGVLQKRERMDGPLNAPLLGALL